MERQTGSFRLDARELDHLGPLLGFVDDELVEVAGRAWKHSAAKVGKARVQLGVGKPYIDLAVKLLDNFDGRVLRRADPNPAARLA